MWFNIFLFVDRIHDLYLKFSKIKKKLIIIQLPMWREIEKKINILNYLMNFFFKQRKYIKNNESTTNPGGCKRNPATTNHPFKG